jgi:hypothetical protein
VKAVPLEERSDDLDGVSFVSKRGTTPGEELISARMQGRRVAEVEAKLLD